ncbi:hypothetical protein CEUSTIGMA_g9636.t1 [Chlamydomonas eustigma]|uniref:Squalene synthase n=1 Tax=Chlamydomonas eustigma TaxID=1157962 RepID=A0A250XGK7_9CHLO|nr:hypothetical protein CEUSTIGMA_g9636.t1 [Chlamydomonas eustigma]|eukprot:GAX82208.1 hypothetical protein CEUSTIGMA_g9636.t1 [Chlamydomonas eustigma]
MGMLGDLLAHPEEFLPLCRMALAAKQAAKLPKHPDLAFCYEMLNNVSRSFAVVIQQLPNPLRDAICIFYLVLRGLDTVEDDMALDNDIKLPMLLVFHEKIYQKDFSMECGYKHYKKLMKEFGKVINVFLSLDKVFQIVIADITKKMGAGMNEFIQKEVITVADYNLYCHYVAGLVGIGLSQLFASSSLEDSAVSKAEDLANHMGLFLQKTNIIRDYLEDIIEEPAPRMFWPKAIWGQYGKSLEDFKESSNREGAVKCLNHMIVDALSHLPFCIQYMKQLRDRKVFRFCAIPQIMAAGTLAVCYNNGKVFEGVVKMRRGQTACVFDKCEDMDDLLSWFVQFLDILRAKVDHEVAPSDPTAELARKAISSNTHICQEELAKYKSLHPRSIVSHGKDILTVAVAAIYCYYSFGLGSGQLPDSLMTYSWLLKDYQQLHQALAALLLLFAVSSTILSSR